jgi:CheY-like chemotaxis protein
MSHRAPKIRVREIPDDFSETPVEGLRALSLASTPETECALPVRSALLGEDNPVNRRVAARVLERLGYTVDRVTSGWEAVQEAAEKDYTVILLDCDTPAFGGYHTVMAIRENEAENRHTPVVALTAHTMQWDRRQREAAGIDGYIAKPIEVDAMTTVIGRLVDNQPQSVAPQLLALDRNVLSRLRDLSGGDLTELRQLSGLFVTTAIDMIARMKQAALDGEIGTIALTAHSLRGSSGQMGA